MNKRLISFLLIVTLIFSFSPIQVSATQIVVSNEELGVSRILIEEHDNPVDLNSNDGVSDYRKWAQGDSRWGSIRLGSSSYTMSGAGCLVTAITKMIIQAGLKDSGSFNPGTMVNWLNNNNGFDSSGNLYWTKPATYSGMTNYGNLVSYGSHSSSANNDKIISWINQGYHIVLNVNNGGHWIAIDEAKTLATGKVYIMDSLYSSDNADVALADRYAIFNLAHAYTGGKTPSSEHECNKGTYKWYWDSHPHYKEYECSICGKVNPFYDETVDLNTCESCRPGKPVLTVDVNDDHVATFTWEETTKTTHYNLWLEKKGDDGNWNSVKQFYEAESGLVYTLEAGEYRAQLLSYNSQMWEPDNSDWVHTWADDVYFSVEDVCRHNYTTTHVDATCVDYGYTTYTCTICGDTYTVYDGDYTEWSTTKPSGVDESLIETKTQYRYADKETTTSYESSLSGWTQAGSQWEQSGSGSIEYVKSWPSGFLTSHSLYSTYNKTPKSASETATDKTAINSDNVTGYLYYHWCRGTYDNGPINRGSRSTKQGEFTAFHAFYSTTNPSTLTSDSDGSVIYSNGDCCKDTYWYFYTPVNTQTYTTYHKLFTYERLGSWSDWSDTVYTASGNRSVETRTLYRAVNVELGEHDYQNGYCTVCGAEDPYYNFESVVLTVANVSAEPGSTVTIPVTISENTGFAGFTLCIDYNESVMTLTNISKGDLLNTSESGSFTKNVSGKTINWVDSANITGDGELMKLTFTVDEDAAPGNYDVSLNLKNDNSTNFVDENSRAIHVEFVNGAVALDDASKEIDSGYTGALTWSLADNGVLTFSGNGAMKNYQYKSEMPWYKYFDQITHIVIEEGVTSIGAYAFYGMPKLESIDIASTVTSIGDYAFKNATKIDNVVLPEGLTSLGDSAFYACTNLTSIDIPASLWTVKPYTFKNCTALAEVTFHEGNLMKISDGSFYNTALTELILPDCLSILDSYTFKNCSKLTSIELGSGLTEIREAVFYASAIPSITIPEGITKIGPYAFKNCVKLETIELPNTLMSVGEASFYACSALESLNLPDTVTKIGNYAFRKCSNLRIVNLSLNLVNIGESSFYGCESIFWLDIPENVEIIQSYAFKGCTSLGILELPNSLKTLGDSAFHTCTGLDEVTIPSGVTKIGDYCFSGSTGIDYIRFEGDAPTIGTGAFNKITAIAYYPASNSTWTASVRQNYGGSISWRAQS